MSGFPAVAARFLAPQRQRMIRHVSLDRSRSVLHCIGRDGPKSAALSTELRARGFVLNGSGIAHSILATAMGQQVPTGLRVGTRVQTASTNRFSSRRAKDRIMLSNGPESRLTQDATSEIPCPFCAQGCRADHERLSRYEFGSCSHGL